MATPIHLRFAALCLGFLALPGGTQQPVLTRDLDKRPLPAVTVPQLSPAMRKAMRASLGREVERGSYTIYRIPVAPTDHEMYLLDRTGPNDCAPVGVNCESTVFDMTARGVVAVIDDQVAGVRVVRRPGLQLPDIAVDVQLGHFATDTTVYRYDGKAWRPYLCKEVSLNAPDDPHPEWIADKPCKP